MAAMSHRGRVLAALNHEQPDRVPIDFGSTIDTTIHEDTYERLKVLLGLEHETAPMPKRLSELVIPHESILQRFDVDTRYLGLGDYEGGVQEEGDGDTLCDEWGTVWQKTGDGHYMFVDGPFFNKVRPGLKDLESHTWPDPDNPGYCRGIRERAAALRKNTDHAIVLNMPAGIIHRGQFMRGFGDWLKDLYKNREFVCRMMDIVVGHWIRLAENALDAADGNVDVVYFGDDLASQAGPLIDPRLYRELIKPHHGRMIAALKARSDVKVLFHSCGAISTLIEDLIDVGADIINPVQVAAKGMEPDRLKRQFGDRISFWGGVDTQGILPFGTPAEVRAEVRRMIDCLGKDGGYIFNSVHNIQNDVPAENVIAMFDEALSYRRP